MQPIKYCESFTRVNSAGQFPKVTAESKSNENHDTRVALGSIFTREVSAVFIHFGGTRAHETAGNRTLGVTWGNLKVNSFVHFP